MGPDLDSRAWLQIAGAIGTIEFAERGTAGYQAFAAYARSLLRPALDRLGMTGNADETPDVLALRRAVIRELGTLGDRDVIEMARQRFAAFVTDHQAISPDDQAPILGIVALNADAQTFEQLHAIARASRDETEMRRYYGALASVRDPDLARKVAEIALSSEIAPQADSLRIQLVLRLAADHPQLSWQVFSDNSERLLKPQAANAPLVIANYVPEVYWHGIALSEVEAWVRAHVPAEMEPYVERGMDAAKFRFAEKQMLVAAADAYLRH